MFDVLDIEQSSLLPAVASLVWVTFSAADKTMSR